MRLQLYAALTSVELLHSIPFATDGFDVGLGFVNFDFAKLVLFLYVKMSTVTWWSWVCRFSTRCED